MKVLVSVFNNLITDQRVEKICQTLYHHNYEVELIGNNWNGLPDLERPYKTHRLQLRSKILKFAYPEFNYKLYFELLKRANSNTILWCNDLDALLANYLVAKKLSIPLIYDSHEIYTEMPAIQGRFTQKIWRFLESKLIHSIPYRVTASSSYGDWFVQKYGIPKPIIVQNFPRKINERQQIDSSSIKTIIYQGAINPSRGLDKIIPAMQNIENAQLLIVGIGPKLTEYQDLTCKFNLSEKVFFLGRKTPSELREITKKADVGISIEENLGLSYYYSLPNKISDYIQAKIPIVVSDFPEMRKVVQYYHAGEIIKDHSLQELSSKINSVLSKGKESYLPELENAANVLCWENEEDKILSLLQQVQIDNF